MTHTSQSVSPSGFSEKECYTVEEAIDTIAHPNPRKLLLLALRNEWLPAIVTDPEHDRRHPVPAWYWLGPASERTLETGLMHLKDQPENQGKRLDRRKCHFLRYYFDVWHYQWAIAEAKALSTRKLDAACIPICEAVTWAGFRAVANGGQLEILMMELGLSRADFSERFSKAHSRLKREIHEGRIELAGVPEGALVAETISPSVLDNPLVELDWRNNSVGPDVENSLAFNAGIKCWMQARVSRANLLAIWPAPVVEAEIEPEPKVEPELAGQDAALPPVYPDATEEDLFAWMKPRVNRTKSKSEWRTAVREHFAPRGFLSDSFESAWMRLDPSQRVERGRRPTRNEM